MLPPRSFCCRPHSAALQERRQRDSPCCWELSYQAVRGRSQAKAVRGQKAHTPEEHSATFPLDLMLRPPAVSLGRDMMTWGIEEEAFQLTVQQQPRESGVRPPVTFSPPAVSHRAWGEVWGQHDHETKVQKVKLGETVSLPCKAFKFEDFGNTRLQWVYDNKGHHHKIYTIGPKGEFREESELKSLVSLENNSTLVINDVQVQDEKLFKCQIEDQHGNIKESSIQLRVYKAPGEPEIVMKDIGIPETENAVEIGTCESTNGFPTPNITWYKNESPLRNGQDAVEVNSQVTVGSSGLITVKSTLFSPVQKSDVDAVFYCEVSYYLPKGAHMKESQKKNITVYYTNTKVTLFIKPQSDKIKEGDTVELICEGNGNPQPEISLYKKGNDTRLKSHRWIVSREDSGGYYCSAYDVESFDEMSAETEMHVHFLDPPVLSEHSPVIVTLGSVLSVSCQANASVQTEIQWKRDEIIIASGHILNISLEDYSNGGQYTCVVGLPSVPVLNLSKELQVIVKGKPYVEVSQQYVEVQRGKNVITRCKATGYPLPKITWYINGSEVDAKIAQVYNVSDNGVVSELTLLVTQDLINENVTCKAYNELDNSMGYILLHEKSGATVVPIPDAGSRSEKSYGVVIVAVIVCILLLAILGAVLYFLYKKGHIPCGRSGKQDITKVGDKDKIVVEMKPDSPAEESVLLPGPQENKQPGDQEKYMDLRN
ncbi:cell surface glycoprotein MUC18 isoform X3 [Pseudophryne corroboree]|uniref:cell surface glycoprotein MUC18 isoform X3 n=1 Tax=Pseudophryne corroboree TaxID=495146 RepID=UPI003081FCDE